MICPNCGYDNLPGSDECAGCSQDLTHLDRPTAHTRVERSLMDENVAALNPPKTVSVRPTATVRQAFQTLIDHNLGAILVVGDGSKLMGIFSERDVLLKIVGLSDSYEELPVSMYMTENPETVTLEDKLAFAVHKMDGGDYRHLPVIKDDKPVGVISVRDVLTYVVSKCKD